MNIQVKRTGFSEYNTELFHLLRLFFEQVKIEYVEQTNQSHALEIDLQMDDNRGIATGKCIWFAEDGQAFTSTHELSMDGPMIHHEQRLLKRVMSHVVIGALYEATGIEQPWGILTGIRPTKLMHNMIQAGSTIEECIHHLQEEYLVSEQKANLLAEITMKQLEVVPDLFDMQREVSIYIGIPFCPTKCAYCTFPAYDIRGNTGSVEGFLEGLHYEIAAMGAWIRQRGLRVTTIYWGGGTPTSISAEQMDALFLTMEQSFPPMKFVRELTVEAGRPDTITPEKIEVMKRWGVDRISINPQSFTQKTLDTIGRHHTVTETIDKYWLSREMGMNNINMDLIVGLPDERMPEYIKSLQEVEKLLPESLTVHALSFKRASKMTQNREEYEVATREEVADMIELTDEWTRKNGYKPYYLYRQKNILGNQENVGYSLEGKESIYNILMMEERQTIIGLGCGAVSKIVGPDRIQRYPNPKEPNAYIDQYKQYVTNKIELLDEVYGTNDEEIFICNETVT